MIRLKAALSFALNLSLIILVALSVLRWLINGVSDQTEAPGDSCFRYFTCDSNILCALCCLPVLFFSVVGLASGSFELPGWAVLLKLSGTAAVAVTLMTVLLFLGPTMGYAPMFEGTNLFLHLICPVLAILSFCLTDGSVRVTFGESLWGVLPTLVYGILYAVMVLKLKAWPDFYGFNRGGLWYVSFPIMIAGTFAISAGLTLLRKALLLF